MNIRNVLTVYTKLRNFTDDESALLETLRTMNDSERELLVETLQPERATTTTTAPRKIEHCEACDYTRRARVHKDVTADGYHEFQLSAGKVKKSRRASGMAAAIRDSLQRGQQAKGANGDDSEDDERCTYKLGDDAGGRIICDTTLDNNVHHKTSDPDYHPFQPSASTAERSSSANGAEVGGTVSSGTETATAGSAAPEASNSAGG